MPLEGVNHLSIIFFLMILGWSSYYSFISLFLASSYHFDTSKIGLFLGVLAGGFGLGFGWLVNVLAQRYSLKSATHWALFIASILTGITAFAPHTPLIACLAAAPTGVAIATAYSMLVTLFSNQVDENLQGWIMGITGAIMAMGFTITGISSAFLADLNVTYPIWFASLFLILSLFAMLNLKTSS